MQSGDVAEWPQNAKFYKHSPIWVPPHCHTSFKQDVGSSLSCQLGFMRRIAVSSKFSPETGFIVRCKKNNNGVCSGKGCIQYLPDIG